ncbi:MAG: DUF4129 domain-containing protein [Dehalococcoidales bacterium]|nr:DUF4129 domain-containing protein [Dehalococcoidales bacterium]
MRLDWRKVIVYGSVMGFDGCALYVLLALLNIRIADSRLSILQFMLVYPLAFMFNKALQGLRPRRLLYPVNFFAWALVTLLMVKFQLYGEMSFPDPTWLLALPQALAGILYSFRAELLLLLSGAIAWWAGWHLARSRASFAASLADFQFSLVIILGTFFAATEMDVTIGNTIPIVLAFFIFALLGISVAHAREEGTGWLSDWRQGHWPGLLLASIGLIIVFGLAIASLVTPEFIQLILAAVAWGWDQVMKGIVFLMSLFPQPGPSELPPGMNVTGGEPKEGGISLNIPEPWLSGLRLSWTILFAGLILLALWRVSSQIYGWLRRKMNSPGAEVDSLPGAFRADILGWLKHIFSRLLGLWRHTPPRQTEPRDLASVRQIYRQLLKWAAASGWRRPVDETPYEYLPTLERLVPSHADDFRRITRHYVNARYGQSPPTPAELGQLKQSWQHISRYRLTPAKKSLAV